QAVRGELVPRAADAERAGNPYDGLQIAEATRAFLDIGLEVVRGVVVLEMPLLLLERLRVIERRHIQRAIHRDIEIVVERARSGDETPLEDARSDRGVRDHLGLAFGGRAHRMTELDTDVPQRC